MNKRGVTDSTARQRGSAWQRTLMAVLGFGLIAAAVGAQFIVHGLGIAPDDDHAYILHLCRVGTVAVAGIFLWLFFRWSVTRDHGRHHRRGMPGSTEQNPTLVESVEAGEELLRRALAEYANSELDKETVFNFVQRLLEPASVRSRMVEAIEVNDSSVRRRCSVQFDPLVSSRGDAVEGVEIIPVLRVERGQMINDLDLRDGNMLAVQTLNHDAYMLLIAVCVLKFLDAAVDLESVKSDALVKQRYTQLQDLMVGATVDRYPLTPGETVESRANVILKELKNTIVVANELEARLLCNLVALTQVTYAIVARVPMTNQPTIFSYSYRERLPQESVTLAASRRKSWLFQDEMRAPLGVDPVEIHIDASRARKTSSYHLEIEAPPGYYVAETWLYDRRTGVAAVKESLRGLYRFSTPYFRCPRPSGDSFAHLYTRGFLRSRTVEPFLYVRFAEKPPGSLGRAWLVSLAILALVWLFGVAASPPSGRSGSLGNVDPGALLVAVPLAFIAVVGFTKRERGYAGTLLSQISLAGSIVLITLILGLLQAFAGNRIFDGSWPSVIMVTHPAWIVLLVLSMIHAAWTGTALWIRYWRWRGLLAKGPSA